MALGKIAAITALMLTAMPLARNVTAQPTPSNLNTIEVSGDGNVQTAPDQATLELAIETHAATAAEAATGNSTMAQKVTRVLKGVLQDKGRMWTGGYSLYPDYSDQPGGESRIISYRAENSITVETGALDLVGPLIDAAIGAGANRVGSLDYDLRDSTKARAEAITKATKDAEAQARALAAALGVKLGPVVKATTISEARPIPVRMQVSAAMMAPRQTPIEAGQVSVPASVSLTYEIE